MNCIYREISDSFGVCPVMVLHEGGEIENIGGSEFLLQLIELVGAHGVDVSSLEMGLVCLPTALLSLERDGAVKVVS